METPGFMALDQDGNAVTGGHTADAVEARAVAQAVGPFTIYPATTGALDEYRERGFMARVATRESDTGRTIVDAVLV